MSNILAVFIGGGVGSVLRYLVWVLFSVYRFPASVLATFCVNVVGSLIIGFLYVYFMSKIDSSEQVRLMLTFGLCGGLTTFSTFSMETLTYIQDGMYGHALFYIASSVIVCLIAAFAGGYVARYFV